MYYSKKNDFSVGISITLLNAGYEHPVSLPIVKIGQSVTILYNKKKILAKVVKIGKDNVIDVSANGQYYFCSKFDKRRNIYDKVTITKNYKDIVNKTITNIIIDGQIAVFHIGENEYIAVNIDMGWERSEDKLTINDNIGFYEDMFKFQVIDEVTYKQLEEKDNQKNSNSNQEKEIKLLKELKLKYPNI